MSVNVDDPNDTLQSQAFTKSLLIGIKVRSFDVENCMVRRYVGDRDASLGVGTYTDTCYGEFLDLLHDVAWSTWSALVHEPKHLMILRHHQGYMRSEMQEQTIQIWFQEAWFDFWPESHSGTPAFVLARCA